MSEPTFDICSTNWSDDWNSNHSDRSRIDNCPTSWSDDWNSNHSDSSRIDICHEPWPDEWFSQEDVEEVEGPVVDSYQLDLGDVIAPKNTRTIMMSDHLNAVGLTAEESRKLSTRSEREDEKTIIRCLKELSSCKPSEKSYEMYAENATFHDPLTMATPLSTIKSQFNGMPKMFSSSTIDKFELLQSPPTMPTPPGPDQFTVINQDVTYYRDGSKLKTLNSLVTLERDPQGKVIRHTEEWSHAKVTDKSDGFLGQLNEWRKIAAAEVIAKLVPEEPPKGTQKEK